MADFKLVTDSTADLPEEYLAEHNIGCINLCYIIGGETYGGNTGKELDWKEFYAMMRAGNMPTTSQVNPEAAREFFQQYIDDGIKKILYLGFSSGLSGTYNSIRIAADELMEENPDCKIIAIDTLAASLGEGLFVYKAVKLMEAGKSMVEVADWATSHVLNQVHMFTVDDLNHLYRGGRVNKATAVIGTIAGIKPILHVDDEGHLIPIDKVRGRKKSLIKLVDYMEEKMGSFKDENDIIFISHGDAIEDAQFVADEVKNRFGIDSFMMNRIGPTIGTHAGPGTIALFFFGDVR